MHSGLSEAVRTIERMEMIGRTVTLQEELLIIKLFTEMSYKGHNQLENVLLREKL